MKSHLLSRIINKLYSYVLKKKFGFYDHTFNDSVGVVMFHKIINSKEVGYGNDFYSFIDDFVSYLSLIQKKYGFIKPDDLFKAKTGILLTFDDATIDLYNNVFPILQKMRIPFVAFVSTGLIGKDGYVSKEQIIKMSKSDLCFIGAHSVNHTMLRFDKNAKNEILKSIEDIQRIINKRIEYFAYPFGSVFACSKRNIKCVSSSSVSLAFSTIPGYILKNTSRYKYFLPRFNGDSLIKELKEGKCL